MMESINGQRGSMKNVAIIMIVIVAPEEVSSVLSLVPGSYALGEVIDGENGVELC